MGQPTPSEIQEGAWRLFGSGQIFGTLYVLDSAFAYYKTYVPVGDPSPTNVDPEDLLNFPGKKIFDVTPEEKFSFDGKVDLYILCFNADSDSVDSGKVLYFPDEDKTGKNVDNNRQDQSTAFDDFFFAQQIGIPTSLTSPIVFDPLVPSYDADVASIADISIGDLVFIFSGVSGEERFFQGVVLGIAVLTVTFDRSLDFSFSIDDIVISTTKELNVDGSVTPQIFEIRSGGATSTLEFDITRILMQALCVAAVDLSTFGDIAGGITRGIQLRDKISTTVFKNKWNIKKNSDFSLLAYDWAPYAKTNPVQGQDGFGWRYSISGEDKHGVVKRIGSNRSLQLIVQDDLTTQTLLEAIGANHEVD